MASEARLNVVLTLIDRMSTNLKSVNRTLAQNRDLLKKVSLAASAFSIASVIAIRSFAKAALDSRQANLLLQTVIQNTGASFEEFWPIIDTTVKNLTKFSNYTDEELKGALTDLIIALGDVPLAIAALPVAMNAAAAAGVGVGDMATQVARFISGETDTIRALGITIDKDVTNPLERLAFLMDKVKGAAEANIDPFKQLSNAMGELKETIGTKLLEILEPLLKRLTDLATSINENVNPALLDIGVKLWLMVTAFVAVTAVVATFLLVLPKLEAAFVLMTGPLGGVLLGLAALGLAIMKSKEDFAEFNKQIDETGVKMSEWDRNLNYSKGQWALFWEETKKAWQPTLEAWRQFGRDTVEAWRPAIETVGEFLNGLRTRWDNTIALLSLPKIKFPEMKLPELNWGDMLSTLQTAWINFWAGLGMPWEPIREDIAGFFDAVSTNWLRFWDSLERGWTQLWSTLNELFNLLTSPITEGWKRFTSGLGDIFKPAANFIIGLAEGMANAVITAVNAMINALNMIQVPDWVWGIGGKGINIPSVASVTIPRLAEGGIVTTPTLAMIGERGPEAVIPLRGQRGGLVINFNAPIYGLPDFERAVAQAVRNASLRGGFYGLKIGSNA